MPKKQEYVFSLRLPIEHMDKLRIVAKENGRSINKEIEILVKQHLEQYEKEHGVISVKESLEI